jgi:C1A family cysteine protease
MRVTPAFFLYKSGVYSCGGSSYDNQNPRYANLNGYHSVRIVGWGKSVNTRTQQEEGYWIAANSWGEGWGERGYFHIRFGECEIEEAVIATYGKSTDVLKKKNRRQ